MFVIAVPSYKRACVLREKTLNTLRSLDSCLITIFVASEEEKAEYARTIPRDMYGVIVVGVIGLVNQRRFIQDYYPIGTNILMMDDDIEGFESLRAFQLFDFIVDGFEKMRDSGCNIWGIAPSANRFFLNDSESLSLKYLIGCFFGILNDRPIDLIYGDSQEDKERTLRYWVRDRKILRFNWIAPKTKYYADGGIMAINPQRKKDTERDTGLICAEFPNLVRQIRKKDTYDIRFRHGKITLE